MTDSKEAKQQPRGRTIEPGKFYVITGQPFTFSDEAKRWLQANARGDGDQLCLRELAELKWCLDNHEVSCRLRSSLLLVRCVLALGVRAVALHLGLWWTMHVKVECIDMGWRKFVEIDGDRNPESYGFYALAYLDADEYFLHAIDMLKELDAPAVKRLFATTRATTTEQVFDVSLYRHYKSDDECQVECFFTETTSDGRDFHCEYFRSILKKTRGSGYVGGELVPITEEEAEKTIREKRRRYE